MDFSQSSYPGNQRFNRSVSQLYVQHELSSRTPFHKAFRIQLFRERLSEKVHVTNPKGILGGFEFTVVQKKGTRGHGRMFVSAKGKQQK